MSHDQTIKDSIAGGWVESMPARIRPFLRLSRYDRPIGFWLLALPGWIGLAFAGLSLGYNWSDLKYALLICIGAIAMRGAGCTYNDIVDRDLDASVERTALRPLAAGTVTIKAAWLWIALQCAVGAIVLSFFPRLAQIIAVSSLGLVAAYPFMKRITFWPQAWLGLTFNWAVLVAYVAKTGEITPPLILLYGGLIFWTIGYDTIYACQDKEDDALIGIKSTARLFGERVPFGVGVCYGLTVALLMMAVLESFVQWLFAANSGPLPTDCNIPDAANLYGLGVLFLMPFAVHLFLQVTQLKDKGRANHLSIFKSNRSAALWLILGLALLTFFLSQQYDLPASIATQCVNTIEA